MQNVIFLTAGGPLVMSDREPSENFRTAAILLFYSCVLHAFIADCRQLISTRLEQLPVK